MTSSLAASLLAGAAGEGIAGQSGKPSPEYYELRLYSLRISMGEGFNKYMREAFVPALNRAGVGPVGVFNNLVGPGSPTVYALLPHKSLESVVTLQARLAADAEYQRAGAAYLSRPATDPLFARVESSLLVAFDSLPKLDVPPAAAKNEPRVFELRTYESPSEAACLKKMEMFTPRLGEMEIFRRVGLRPVFFGRTLVGPRLPNFTYMLTYPDLAAREKNWAAFGADPEWQKLRATPGYADAEILSNITNLLLRPAGYSQV